MITKAEFYGQYFLSLRKDDEDFTPWQMVKIDRAWEVIAELQGEPDRIEGYISADEVAGIIERTDPIFHLKAKSFITDEQAAEIKGVIDSYKI